MAKRKKSDLPPVDRDPGELWIGIAKDLLDDVSDKTRKVLEFEIACGLRASYDDGRKKGFQDAIDALECADYH